MKKEFEDVKIEIIYFCEDIILTSSRGIGAGEGYDDDDGNFLG